MTTMVETGCVVRNLELVDVDALSYTDLREAGIAGVISESVCAEEEPFGPSGAAEDEVCRRWIIPHGTTMACYRVTVGNANDLFVSHALHVEAVVIADQGASRIGIAWGADADWGDLHVCPDSNADPAFEGEVLVALNDWLRNPDAWAARG